MAFISLDNPAFWVEADLVELSQYANEVDDAFTTRMDAANQLEKLGTKVVHQRMRNKNFDHEAFGDLKVVVATRIKLEQPDPDDILGKLPHHPSVSGFEKLVQQRIQFLQQHGYPDWMIVSAQRRLLDE